MHADIDASSGIQAHDPSVRAGKDGSCLNCATTVIGAIMLIQDKIYILNSADQILQK
jgi:hypothetical protein